jgi:hypothetical protein
MGFEYLQRALIIASVLREFPIELRRKGNDVFEFTKWGAGVFPQIFEIG